MKKSTAIRLTLVSAFTLGASSCGQREEGPRQTLRGWCDPDQPEVCEDRPRAGFIPMFIPMYWGGYYYDNRGLARTRPGGAVVANAPRPAVTRGGFGSTGASRTSGSRSIGA